MATLLKQNKTKINPKKFICEICNFETKQKSNLDRHLKTQKHILCAEQNIFFFVKTVISLQLQKETIQGIYKHKNTR